MEDSDRKKMAEFSDRIGKLTSGKSGAYSLRNGKKVLISPSAVRYEEIEPTMISVLTMDGKTISSKFEPSSETPLLLSIYRELSAHAIVHVHSPWATTVSALNESLSFVHYSAALTGTEVPIAGYETFGTDDLADEVVGVLNESDAKACLMANHGQVAYAETLEKAFEYAQAVEFTARVECQARAAGTPEELGEEQIELARQRFRQYGQSGG